MPTDSQSSSELRRDTILVVEPDILVRMIISDYLRDCGYRVFEAATADDAMAVLGSQQTVDIVFTEVQLGGGMDGFDLAQWVRANHPGTDVILTSGVRGAAAKAAELCDEGPLPKPYQPQEVVYRINIVLERRRTAPRGED